MIRTLLSLGNENQFEKARWIPNIEKRNEYKLIKVEIIDERRKQFSKIISNFVTSADTTVLKTSSVIDCKVGQEVYYRGEYWAITAVSTITKEVAPQAMSVLREQSLHQTLVEVTRVQ